jgi:hypothetical protein
MYTEIKRESNGQLSCYYNEIAILEVKSTLKDWEKNHKKIPFASEYDKLKVLDYYSSSSIFNFSSDLINGQQVDCIEIKEIPVGPANGEARAFFKNPDIKGDTCPTCGSKVKIVGGTTKHYQPIENKETDIIGNNTSIHSASSPGNGELSQDQLFARLKNIVESDVDWFENLKKQFELKKL